MVKDGFGLGRAKLGGGVFQLRAKGREVGGLGGQSILPLLELHSEMIDLSLHLILLRLQLLFFPSQSIPLRL